MFCWFQSKVFLKKCQTIPFFSIFQTEARKNKFVYTVKYIDDENKLKNQTALGNLINKCQIITKGGHSISKN